MKDKDLRKDLEFAETAQAGINQAIWTRLNSHLTIINTQTDTGLKMVHALEMMSERLDMMSARLDKALSTALPVRKGTKEKPPAKAKKEKK